MFITNEPGYYEEGFYGIRTESLLAVRLADTRRNFGDGQWLEFERVTQVPIDIHLIDWSLLSPEEIVWVRRHNADVVSAVRPLVAHDTVALRWLTAQLVH